LQELQANYISDVCVLITVFLMKLTVQNTGLFNNCDSFKLPKDWTITNHCNMGQGRETQVTSSQLSRSDSSK